ncbi:M3 family metallopeptidase [Pseudomonas purpurea]|uniref:M3 family metallopeptidase n=1 Tax=Pseudomonas purpurea TaxID=3136737 RepID=UPI003265526A
MLESNPLLQVHGLPPYAAVRAEHLVPAIEQILADNRRATNLIVASQSVLPNWDDLVLGMDELTARLDETMSVIHTLDLVAHAGDAWRKARAACDESVAVYKTGLLRNRELYLAYQALADSPPAQHFDASRQAVLKKILRRYRLSGVDLPADQQATLARLNREISLLGGLFLQQLENADNAWSKRLNHESSLAGLPDDLKQRMAAKAREAGHEGWLITLDQETWRLVMTYAEDRTLREELFIANATRASDQGPHAGQFDNGPVLELLLANRQQKARLLGYANFAELKLATESAESARQVVNFLQRQLTLETPRFAEDTQALEAFAAEQGVADVQAWDLEFYAQKLRQYQHGSALSGVRAYFPLDGTLHRLCRFSERLFGIEIVEQQQFSRWHEQVRLLEVREHSQVIGHIYIDPFHRPQGDDYAWTSTPRNRRVTAEGRVKLPMAILHGNFPEGATGQPCLLDHVQMRVLLHEMGHCLQHVLTRSPYRRISGISELGRDTAEFAGQVFELWGLSRDFLLWIAAHHQTGERLSEARVDSILASIHQQSSWQTARLLMGALYDFELHRGYGDGRSVASVFAQVREQFPHLRLPGYTRYANGFDYLVTGYEASVYAYIWSGVLATEAFKPFEARGVFSTETGKAFREAIFAVGDSRPLLESLEVFLGRSMTGSLFPS